MILLGLGSVCSSSMYLLISSAAAWSPAIPVSYTLACSPSTKPCLNTLHPWTYPTTPYPDLLLLLLLVSEPSEYTMRYQSSSSISVMNSMCLSVQSSFDDWPGVLVRRNICMLSGMSTSVSLHGSSGCGFVHSMSSSILLLILVIHIVNLIFGLPQCFLVMS